MINWKNKNVFITGADGFIGSWLAKKLVERGKCYSLGKGYKETICL